MMQEITEYKSREDQADKLADIIADVLEKRIEARRQATIAVPGGSTPELFLTALGKRTIDWSSVTVLPTDERWIPPANDRSNERLIRRTLMAHGAKPQLFSFWRKGMMASHAAAGLSIDLGPHLPLDVCVLGMGEDMHCASLFPGGDGLTLAMAHGAPAVVGMNAPGLSEPRVSLSADALSGGQVHLLITGEEKLSALEAAIERSSPLTAPIGAVLRRNENTVVHWAP